MSEVSEVKQDEILYLSTNEAIQLAKNAPETAEFAVSIRLDMPVIKDLMPTEGPISKDAFIQYVNVSKQEFIRLLKQGKRQYLEDNGYRLMILITSSRIPTYWITQ